MVYFVSGIDTDAGKTFATGIVAKRFMDEGKSVITHKFIQTGGEAIDIAQHRKLMGMELTEDDKSGLTCPVIFSYPASPHLAAKLDNREIDFDAINNSIAQLEQRYDVVITEGAGGLFVPLKGLYTTIDYIAESGFPLIFVTSGKLGSINHTLLSLECCRNRGIEVAMVVYNHYFGEDKVIDDDTFEYIKMYLSKYHPNALISEI